MATTKSAGVSSSLSTNLFSGDMVLLLFVQIMLIILDRVIYLYRSVLGKILMQYATVAFWFTKIFLTWPVSSQRGFTANPWLQFFFVIKLLYFVCSGLQIYSGFPPAEFTGMQFLTRFPGVYTVLAYRVYRALPFVFELRTMLDWMCAKSSLDLWDTLKVDRHTQSTARLDTYFGLHRSRSFVSFCLSVLSFLFSWRKFTGRCTSLSVTFCIVATTCAACLVDSSRNFVRACCSSSCFC